MNTDSLATPGISRGGWARSVAPVAARLTRAQTFGALMPVVMVLNAAVGMALPKMMTPDAFGTYALVVTLFQYGLIFDMGASQLADRTIPAMLGRSETEAAVAAGQELLWLRLLVACVTLAVLAPGLFAAASLGWLRFPPALGLLAAFAGIAYMVALGPACLYRARSERRDYALSIVALSGGLTIARPGGLLAGGSTGCFAALACWYVGFALLLHARLPPRAALRPSLARCGTLLARGLPFFATSFIWAFYVTGNRWFAQSVIPRAAFGEFAFAANIFSLLVGAVSGFSAFWYPRLSEGIARGGAFALSGRLVRDCGLLVAGVAVVMATGILLAGPLIGLIYPHYHQAVPAARLMLVAVPSVVFSSWLMPVSLSNGKRPWIDGLVMFPLATVILGVAVHTMFALWGASGAAAASTASALPLVLMQLVLLRQTGILKTRDAGALFGATLLASALLALLARGCGS